MWILFEPKSLFEENWAESKVKNTLRANASKSSHLIIDGTRVNDVRVYEDEIMQTVIRRYGTGGGNVPIIFTHKQSYIQVEKGKSPTLTVASKGMAAVFPIQDSRDIEKAQWGMGVRNEGDPAYTLDTMGAQGFASNQVVRRLTPMECERLQGFPDDWTAGQADSNRYKQMGNAVAVPVVQWIINRVVEETA